MAKRLIAHGHRVTMVCGWSDLLWRFDIGLMVFDNVPAFSWGTSPNKFFDYLSSGLSVFINYPSWLADIVIRNKCGVAVPPGNPAAFAEALIKLADQFVSFLSKIYKQ